MLFATLYHDKDGVPAGYTLIGHAGMAPEGQDILCSALSMMAINTANALCALTEDTVHIVSNEEEALLDVRVDGKPGERAEVLLSAFDMACCSIRDDKQYDPYFSLKREEIKP